MKAVVEDCRDRRMRKLAPRRASSANDERRPAVHGRRRARALAGREDHLHGNLPVEPLVATQEHNPHAAPAQLANQAIPILKAPYRQ